MSYYFTKEGLVNYRRLALTTSVFFTAYTWAFVIGQARVQDTGIESFTPSNFALSADRVLYSKLKPRHWKDIHGKIIAFKNPFNPS
jgi:hypothetical protein